MSRSPSFPGNRYSRLPAVTDYAGIFQADAFGGYNELHEADRKPGPILEAGAGPMRAGHSSSWRM